MEKELQDGMGEKQRLTELRSADAVETPGGVLSKMEIPPWFDQKKFNRAQKVFRDYYAATNFAHLCGLLMSFYFAKSLKTLRSTGESDTKFSLFHRYMMTIRHIQRWYEGDVWNSDDPSHRSLSVVRSLHAAAGTKMNSLKDGNVYVSQWEMMLTQWAFVGPVILFRSRVGFHGCSDEDFEAFAHFWRTIGYLLGIQDKYNLCSGDYEQVHKLSLEILKKEYKKVMIISHPDSITMGKSVTSAMNMFDWWIQWPLFDSYIHELAGLSWSHTMTVLEWILYYVMRFALLYVGQIEILRQLFNNFYRWKVNKALQLDLQLQSGKHHNYTDSNVIYSTS